PAHLVQRRHDPAAVARLARQRARAGERGGAAGGVVARWQRNPGRSPPPTPSARPDHPRLRVRRGGARRHGHRVAARRARRAGATHVARGPQEDRLEQDAHRQAAGHQPTQPDPQGGSLQPRRSAARFGLMHFSGRTPALDDLGDNALSVALAERRAAGLPILDLAVSNPTRVGLSNTEGLAAFEGIDFSIYAPEARGPANARRAVAAYYRDAHQHPVSPDDIVLTASTSEAYALLFKLVGDAGDQVLIPAPSYPLLDTLLRVEALRPVTYPLYFAGDWSIDLHALEAAITPRTRAIVVVHPNNPTGHFVSQAECDALLDLCARHGLVLISDEVFCDWRATGTDHVAPAPLARFSRPDAPVFSISGASKVCALPQIKLGWVLCGQHREGSQTLARLEWLNDAFLSVSGPTVVAAPEI